MSAHSIKSLNALATLVGKPTQTVRFTAGTEDGFRIGEIVRARVLRQTGENRYSLQFRGGERQVDSAIPFSAGDILYGRVVGLGSQVEVERVRVERGESERSGIGGAEQTHIELDRHGVATFSQRPQKPLTSEEMRIINAFKGGADKNYLSTLAGLALRNLGIGVSSAGIEGLLSAIGRKGVRGVFPPIFSAKAHVASAEGAQLGVQPSRDAQALQLAQLIKQLVEHLPEAKEHRQAPEEKETGAIPYMSLYNESASLPNPAGSQQDGNEEQDPARWMLNIESDSSVGHRINTIPLLVNGQLIELNVALFEERGNGSAPDIDAGNRYRAFVMSFSTPHLGRLEIRATTHGKNLSFSLTSDREDIAERFAASSSELKAEFEQSDWKVAEMTYRHGEGKFEASSHAVLWHLANLDRYEIYV